MRPTLDPNVFMLHEYERIEPRLRFDAETPEAARQWQRKARRRLSALMGDFPQTGEPVPAKVIGEVKRDGWTRTKLLLETQPGLLAVAYWIVPDNCPPKSPAMLCVPGHGYGLDDIVGIHEDGTERTEKVGYQYDYALQCVERGFPTLALEVFGFGERRDEDSVQNKPKGETACHIAGADALMLGRTITGYRVHDCRRGLDWLERQDEVDPKRMGMLGISGGGLLTFHTAAVDMRIKAAFVSGYLNTFKDSVYTLWHCIDNFIPGILRYFEMPDLAGLVAPRWSFYEQGLQDPIFPIKGFRQAKKEVQRIYEVFGVPERCGFANFEGQHAFSGKKGLPFVEKALTE